MDIDDSYKMKNFLKNHLLCILFVTLALLSFTAKAQQPAPYTLIVNDPSMVPSTYIDLVYFDYEGTMSNPDKWNQNVAGLGSTIQAEIKPMDKIGVQGKLSFYWYGDKKEVVKLPTHLEGGAVMSIGSKIKEQDIKVPLRYFKTKVDVVDDQGRWRGTTDGIGMNYIEVKAKKEFRTWARAGALLRRSTYRPNINRSSQLGSETVVGVYAGIEVTRKAHVVAQLADREAVSAEYLKFYGDLMIFPVAAHSTPDRGKRTPVGFRLGMTGKAPGMRHFANYMAPKVEIGMWPLDGWFWSVGFGMSLYKS